VGIVVNGSAFSALVIVIPDTARRTIEPFGVKGAAAQQKSEMALTMLLADLKFRQKRMEQLGENGQGQAALVAQATARLLQKQRAVVETCYTAFGPVKNGHLLNMAQVEQPEELTRRKESVRNFAAAYKQLQEFGTNVETIYRVELEKSGVSMDQVRGAMQSLHTNMGAVNLWLSQMGEENSRWAEAELAALDLLSINWGKWSYDQNTKKLQFQDDSQAEVFNRLVRQINDSLRHANEVKQKMPLQQ
jgi:hypothetical protein